MKTVATWWWDDFVGKQSDEHEAEMFPAEQPLYIMYTSGSTGKPKGILHTTGGYLVGCAYTHWGTFDLKAESDVFWTAADIGWVTGHSYLVYGPLANGATSLMYEGTLDTPHRGRWWELIEKYKVTILYCAPTAIRTSEVGRRDSGTIRSHLAAPLGSVGEADQSRGLHLVPRTSAVTVRRWSTPGGRPRPMHMISPMPGVTEAKPGAAMRAVLECLSRS